jgi:hypothetical protein
MTETGHCEAKGRSNPSVTARNEAVPHFTERASKRVTLSDRRDLVRFKNYNKKFISTKKGTS